MLLRQFFLACLAFFATQGATLAAAPASDPDFEFKFKGCLYCHGQEGISPRAEVPHLAGQNASYTVKQLNDFISGKRQSRIMTPMASGLSQADFQKIAAYFARKARAPRTASDARLVEQGKALYSKGDRKKGLAACSTCHGNKAGGSNTGKVPALAGQHSGYLMSQLDSYRKGQRSNDQSAMMRGVAKKLSDEDIQALAAYLANLPN